MNTSQIMTRDDIIRTLLVRGDRYGSLLLALMNRWGVTSLREITSEQAQIFWEEINQCKNSFQQSCPAR